MSIPDNFVKKRSCTNCCFLFIFICFLISWSLLTYFAFKFGDPEQIILPVDSKGSICGRGAQSDKPYLFYFNILKCAKIRSLSVGCDTQMVCVSKCPDFTRSYSEFKTQQAFEKLSLSQQETIRKNLTCIPEVADKIRTDEIPLHLAQGHCASLYLKSEPRFSRCFPSDLRKKQKVFLDDANKAIEDNGLVVTPEVVKKTSKAFAITFNAKALGELILSDLLTIKHFIIYGLLIGAITSFLWIILMQIMASVMVWASMVILIFFSGYASFYSYKTYNFYASKNQTEIDILEEDSLDITDIDLMDIIKVQFQSILTDKRLWLAILVLSSVCFFLLTITFIALRKRVQIAISLIREASKAIMEAKFTLFLPLIEYVAHLALFIFSVIVAVLILATHKPAFRFQDGPNVWQYCDARAANAYNCTRYQLLSDQYIYYAQGFNLFGFLWVWFFIHGMFQLIFAGVFSRYYWTFNKKKNLPTFLILNSTYSAFRYHTGSIALGAFLNATIKLIRIIIEWIDKKCKQYTDNPVAKGIVWCMRCGFWLLDNFLRYVNTNAYVMIAVFGKDYFTSAKDAFNLILANIVRAVIIDKVADYLLFFGKLAVTAFIGFGTYWTIEHYVDLMGKEFPTLNYPHLVPIATIGLGTYLIASSFFSVYEMAVNTIFLCFLKDCEENDGSDQKPYYMSQSLLRILNYSNHHSQKWSSDENQNHNTSNKIDIGDSEL